MPKVHLQRRMRHSPEDMLALVADVPRYPEFINLVSSVRVLKTETISETHERFTADVGIAYKFISEQFRSQVNVDKEAKTLSIERAGHGGAVKYLRNDWHFIALKDGSTLIDFRLNVRLKAAPLEFLIKQKFGKATDVIMNAFETRAGQICKVVGDDSYDFKAEAQALAGQSRL